MTVNKPEVFEVYRTKHDTPENMVLLADYEALQAERDALVEVLESLLEMQDEDCRYDHQGYCQNHNLDHVDDGCRVARAKTALAAHRKGGDV